MKPDSIKTLDLIAVLGMHRSGTSAITRGLQALGVELGGNLMPPLVGNNAKGFFEDLDIVDFNISLLNHLCMDWHHVSPVTASQVEDLCASGYLLKAAALIRQKIATEAPYGIKDPRLSKLMPFWEKVFQHCELNVGYVIAIRNPISVANSLKIRDGFSFEKSYLLWLDHTLAALIHTEGCNRVILDFDLVLENPTKQLGRVADALGLNLNANALSEYTSKFLDKQLRSNIHQPQDLAVDSRIPPLMRELYAMLQAEAITEHSLSISKHQLADFEKGRNNLLSSMVYIDRLNQAIADRDGRIAALEENTAEHCKRAETFELIVKSAERWQRRSWFKRTFHRWRAANDNRNKIHVFRKLERSIRKRRNQLLRENYIISKNIIKCTNALKFNYSTLIKSIPFHKSGKPRGWVRLLIFHKNKKPRRTFRRLAYKKSGYPRAVFIAWINHKKIILLDHVSANDSLFKQNNINLQSIAVSISVVIPTYNRANFLKETVQSVIDSAVGLNVEVIVVNDGSSDHTAEVLHQLQIEHPHLRFLTIPNQGAGVARNHGAASAKNDIILFMGDDILPASRDFLAAHSRYHQSHNQNNIGILGKVDWPPDDIFEITPVMRHIQGPGGEQFGYTDMEPHKQWDWRFFYTCNVSVKRHIVDDWLKEGFSPAFTGCGFEDGEFAYRMGKKYGEFPVLYIDESIGHHFHRHTVRSFLQRQHFAGAMAKVLSDLHPDTLAAAGFIAVHEALMTNAPQQPSAIFENLALAESLFSWAKSLEETGILGTESWHKELLHCVFKISAFMGFIDNSGTPTSNHSAASNYVLDSSCIPLMKALPKKNWNAKGFMS